MLLLEEHDKMKSNFKLIEPGIKMFLPPISIKGLYATQF